METGCDFSCPKNCSYKTKYVTDILKHLETCTDNNEINDTIVKFENVTNEMIDADICPICEVVFCSSKELLKHVFAKHRCSECNNITSKDEVVSNVSSVISIHNNNVKSPIDKLPSTSKEVSHSRSVTPISRTKMSSCEKDLEDGETIESDEDLENDNENNEVNKPMIKVRTDLFRTSRMSTKQNLFECNKFKKFVLQDLHQNVFHRFHKIFLQQKSLDQTHTHVINVIKVTKQDMIWNPILKSDTEITLDFKDTSVIYVKKVS